MHYPKDILYDTGEILETICPNKILIIGKPLHNIANNYQQQCSIINIPCDITFINTSDSLSEPAYLKRYDLAIAGGLIESHEKTKSEQVLSRLRDLCAPKIIMLGSLTNSTWHKNELFGFGFTQYARYQHIDMSSKNTEFGLYHYNIDSYKKTPEWFSAKNWANPELWNKFRW